MRDAVGFHNLLVHRYAHVDDALVLEHLQSGRDALREFARAVERYVNQQNSTS